MSPRILLALDGSRADEAAFLQAQRLAARGAHLHLLHIVPSRTTPVGTPLLGMAAGLGHRPAAVAGSGAGAHLSATFPPSAGENEIAEGESRVVDRACRYLEGYRRRLREVPGQDLVRSGAPAQAILHVALTFDIDLIVMSTRARSGVARWFTGSISQTVLGRSQLPVLLVRRGIPARPERIRRILVPLSRAPESRAILNVVKPLAVRLNAEVLLLEIVDPIHPGPGLEDVGGEVGRAGAAWRALTVYGDPAEQILHHSKSRDADLVAMSAPAGKGWWRSARSVPESVLLRSDRAVLLQNPLIHAKR